MSPIYFNVALLFWLLCIAGGFALGLYAGQVDLHKKYMWRLEEYERGCK